MASLEAYLRRTEREKELELELLEARVLLADWLVGSRVHPAKLAEATRQVLRNLEEEHNRG